MREIPVTEIGGIRIGQAEDIAAGTGITVFLSDTGVPAGLDVRGGGPASRESQLLNPLMNADRIHAVVLSGGSAFGLDAAGGVQRYLEERGIGFDVGVAKVPLVCQSCLFDLTVGRADVRPDAAMAYRACENAEQGNYRDGCFGAGTGATVGKICGMDLCMKSGIGSYAIELGGLKVGAVAAVNALGDVYDPESGMMLAGLRTPDGKGLRSGVTAMTDRVEPVENRFVTYNTTLGVVMTNAAFTKAQLCKIAGMAQDGYARAIRPVHTSADGDSAYALSTGTFRADMDLVGVLAADVMAKAIRNAVLHAESGYGYPAMRDMQGGKAE